MIRNKLDISDNVLQSLGSISDTIKKMACQKKKYQNLQLQVIVLTYILNY